MVLRYLLQGQPLAHCRWMCSKPVITEVVRVDKNLLAKIRKKTRFPIQKCKNALIQCNNDYTAAIALMNKAAQEEGWEKASKLGDRPMSQGLIGLIRQKNISAMIEVNCETDFVARNEKFFKLVHNLTSSCLENGKATSESKILWDKTSINELKFKDKKHSDLVALEIGLIGENIAISRGAFMRGSDDQTIGSFVHFSGATTTDYDCQMGKFGALVAVRKADPLVETDKETIESISTDLAQHVVGVNPKEVGKRLNTEEQSEPTANDASDNSSKMIHQEYLMDESVTVGEFCVENNLVIQDFIRFECGEDLEE